MVCLSVTINIKDHRTESAFEEDREWMTGDTSLTRTLVLSNSGVDYWNHVSLIPLQLNLSLESNSSYLEGMFVNLTEVVKYTVM